MRNFKVIILFSKDTSIEPTAIIKDELIDECYSSFEFDTWRDAVHCINWINIMTSLNNSKGIYDLLGDWADNFGYTQFGEFRGNHNQFKNSLEQWRIYVYGADFEYIDNNDDILNFSVWNTNLKSISVDEMN